MTRAKQCVIDDFVKKNYESIFVQKRILNVERRIVIGKGNETIALFDRDVEKVEIRRAK